MAGLTSHWDGGGRTWSSPLAALSWHVEASPRAVPSKNITWKKKQRVFPSGKVIYIQMDCWIMLLNHVESLVVHVFFLHMLVLLSFTRWCWAQKPPSAGPRGSHAAQTTTAVARSYSTASRYRRLASLAVDFPSPLTEISSQNVKHSSILNHLKNVCFFDCFEVSSTAHKSLKRHGAPLI